MIQSDDPKDIALSINHVHKDFVLPHERKNSLKERLLHPRSKTSYDYLHALHDINFEVRRGEFFGIVGRNGSGKSTLLKIIGGIYQPTKGNVQVNGTLTPFIELGIGFNPELTGRENVYLNGAILGLTRKEVSDKYEEIVAFAELSKFMDQKLKNYSSGMQVRLAFSIAIQAHNDILLIDEVLAVGDSNFQRKCFKIFREIKNSGKTVIFVTHAMGSVQEFCDRAMMIQDSKMVAIGEPREIAMRYEIANSSDADKSEEGAKLKRPTNSEIKITNFKITKNGRPTTRFGLEDTITAEITIDVKKPLEIQTNFYFVKPDGSYLAGINSTKDIKNFTPKKGRHTLVCKIPADQFVKDDYLVGTAIYSTDDVPELIDIIDKGYSSEVPRISITESSVYQNGQFYVRGKWTN